MTEMKVDEFEVRYDPETQTVVCQGQFMLNGVAEYADFAEILNSAAATKPPLLTLDLREMQFLNSSGINVISRFVLTVRKSGACCLRVLGSKAIPWQGKSLVNLQRLMPGLELIVE